MNSIEFINFLPYVFLALSIISLWFSRRMMIWGSLLVLGIITGLVTHRLNGVSLITIAVLALGYFLTFKTKHRFFKLQFAILSLVFSMFVFFHKMPGFNNLEILHQFKLSANAIPYSFYLNFDKPLIGLFILAFGWSFINQNLIKILKGNDFKKILLISLIIFFLTLTLLPIIALTTNYVQFEPKWTTFFYLWILDNLIFTCVAEEVLFRGFLQNGLITIFKKTPMNKVMGNVFCNTTAVLLTAILFGLAHYKGGMAYISLATLSGIFYGWIYFITKRIESSILLHFFLNLTHIVFFSYPALAHH